MDPALALDFRASDTGLKYDRALLRTMELEQATARAREEELMFAIRDAKSEISKIDASPRDIERGTVRTIGELEMPAFPLRFSAVPELLDFAAATLGEHNAEVLSGLLGYDDERAGVLHRA